MIIFSDIQLLRGGKVLLDHTSATIHPGDKVGLVGKNGCGKSSLFALLRDELHLDGGSCQFPSSWQVAWVAQETPALERTALEYVIDGDREYRDLEGQLHVAEAADDGHRLLTCMTNLRPLAATASKPGRRNCSTAWVSARSRWLAPDPIFRRLAYAPQPRPGAAVPF